jgi:hypothetical protein
MALGVLTACIAQTTTAYRPSNQSKTALPTRISEIRDRNNFRDKELEQRLTTIRRKVISDLPQARFREKRKHWFFDCRSREQSKAEIARIGFARQAEIVRFTTL